MLGGTPVPPLFGGKTADAAAVALSISEGMMKRSRELVTLTEEETTVQYSAPATQLEGKLVE